jgi:hypothetical protein
MRHRGVSIDPVIGCACRFFVTLVFGAASIHKLRSPREFLAILREYRLVPGLFVVPIGFVLVGAEILVAAGIWVVEMQATAAGGAIALLAAYAAAIGINLQRGRREIDCGCSFGSSQQPLSPALLVRNAVLLLPCAVAGLPLNGPVNAVVLCASLLAAVAFGLCYHLSGVLLANHPRVLRLRGQ